MRKRPLKLNIFLLVLYAVTVFSFYYFVKNGFIRIHFNKNDINMLMFFSILMALTESFSVEFKNISFSTGFAVTIAIFILRGPLVALIVVIAGYSLRIVKTEEEYIHLINIPIYINLFNYCILALPVMYGNYFYKNFGGILGDVNFSKHLVPIGLFCLTTFLLNVIIMGIMVSIRSNDRSTLYYIASNIKLGALNFLAMAPLGLIAAFIFYYASYGGLALFIFPIILARFTFSQYIEAKTKYIQTVDVIMHAMEARDKYTEGHSKRVADISNMIARELKYNEWKIENLNIAALLHDVGKIGIDDHILNKPEKLTDEEYNTIKQHPEIGYKILKDIKGIEEVKSIVKYHHERYDGMGYPEGKRAEELSLEVFIVQLADSIDAMSTNRPYRKAMEEEEIIEEVKRCKGTQFHPTVVDAYMRVIEKNKVA